MNLNQWKSTKNVLTWFNGIENKHLCKFITFDVKDFYLSISESLLVDAVTFASKLSVVTPHEREIIFHRRISLLFNNGESWMKKGGKLFGVTMGAYDGAEVCELVGCYILNKSATKYQKKMLVFIERMALPSSAIQ